MTESLCEPRKRWVSAVRVKEQELMHLYVRSAHQRPVQIGGHRDLEDMKHGQDDVVNVALDWAAEGEQARCHQSSIQRGLSKMGFAEDVPAPGVAVVEGEGRQQN
jgi:hypothetical protein